jgi:hypothetical protein
MIIRCDSTKALLHPAVEAVILFGFWEIVMFREHACSIHVDGTVNETAKRYLSMKQSG